MKAGCWGLLNISNEKCNIFYGYGYTNFESLRQALYVFSKFFNNREILEYHYFRRRQIG